MRLLLLLMLSAVPVLADECLEACFAEFWTAQYACYEEFELAYDLCMAHWWVNEGDECDYAYADCLTTAGGDPKAEAVCDSIWSACWDVVLGGLEECFDEAEWWKTVCEGLATEEMELCIEDCEGAPTRCLSWGTVKALYWKEKR